MKHLNYFISLFRILFILILLFNFIALNSCKEDREDEICLVLVRSGEGGTAKTSKDNVFVNEQVILTAEPEESYRFVNWTINGVEVSKNNPYKVVITSNVQYQANFEKDNFKVNTISTEGGGAKLWTSLTTTSTQAYVLNGTKITVDAIPKEGYYFVNWTINGKIVLGDMRYEVVITSNTVIKANLKKNELNTHNGKGYVDLGLRVKWATCNVGANSPEEYGDYFAWGETQPKSIYNWSTYKYCNGDEDSMTKYCTKSYYGTVDNKTTLDLEDDAAHVNWGGKWRMPTSAEMEELRNNCTWTNTTQNGVYGLKMKSKKNGNSIFFPMTGYYGTNGFSDRENFCWSSSLWVYNHSAYTMRYGSGSVDIPRFSRNCGRSVRAVCP